jgi:hypothetical protein
MLTCSFNSWPVRIAAQSSTGPFTHSASVPETKKIALTFRSGEKTKKGIPEAIPMAAPHSKVWLKGKEGA